MKTHNQKVRLPLLEERNISLTIKREDEIHPIISGNKYRKLKYNLIEARKQGQNTLLSFGGAFSNHIAATACVGKEEGFKTIGVIRGDELENKWKHNLTLRLASEHGMYFHFINRKSYKNKEKESFIEGLRALFGGFYLLPEGGTNSLAVLGCEEILTESDRCFDIVATSVGTGGTIAGLINSIRTDQKVWGFGAVRGDFITQDIRKFAKNSNWRLISDYHFGGYAKVTKELILFINQFKSQTGIPLDPIYTGKMVYGILDMVKKGRCRPGTKILIIHTGGLQGIQGMNVVLKKKKLPLINL